MLIGFMDNLCLNGVSNLRNNPSTGQTSLPPKFPSLVISQSSIHSITIPNDGQVHIPRSCSARILIEEQPPWFEELLNEPELPMNRGHRRSSSDPFTYLDANSREREEWLKNIAEEPSGVFQKPSSLKYLLQTSSSGNPSASNEHQNSLWRSSTNSASFPSDLEEDVTTRTSALPSAMQEQNTVLLTGAEVQSQGESASHNAERSSGGSNGSYKPSALSAASMIESKRAKQHNGRRSRVRKLQYIAELERNVQALQAEGSEVSAELEFLDQQNLILSMENRALKQRLESLSQLQLIKSMEQEILEREIVRLQLLYHR